MRTSPTGIAVLACLAAFLNGPVRAQDTIPFPVASRLVVKVDGRVTSQTGDRVRLDYKITNLTTSQQALRVILIKAAVPFSSYEMHGPLAWWPSKGIVHDSSVVHWSPFDNARIVVPGASLTGFTVSANGVLGVLPAWAQGDYDLPELDEDTELAPPPTIYANSYSTFTIGHVPTPGGATVGALVTRLRGLVDQSCGALGWITSAGLCSTLVAQLTGTPVQLTAFRDSLNANRETSASLADNPYYLLRSNRDYIRSLITTSSFTLLYVCGNRFTARSRVDVALPASYTVNNTLETGALALTPKPAGGEWGLTNFTVANQGTIRLLYDGTVYRTQTPTYTTCP